MTTAIDTNVLQALWSGTPPIIASAQAALRTARQRGALVISAVVYAELVASPWNDATTIETFFNASRIRVDWLLERDIWRTAADAYRSYSERRRKQERNEGPRRILADFLIGAHALHHTTALITFDQGIYRAAFPSLTIVVPSVV